MTCIHTISVCIPIDVLAFAQLTTVNSNQRLLPEIWESGCLGSAVDLPAWHGLSQILALLQSEPMLGC